MRIGQIGLGYVGLTSAVTFALRGHTVLCYDTNPDVVMSINQSTPKSGEFLQYLQADVKGLVEKKLLSATTNIEALDDCDAYLLSVPTERQDEPYMDIVNALCSELLLFFNEDSPLIIIESTVTPGTTEKIVEQLLDKGYKLDEDYHLAIAPRRDWFADAEKSVANLPRVVGGASPDSTERAVKVLANICRNIQVTTADVAELTKSVENALLNVQVTFCENLASSYSHVDVNRVIELATTHWRLNPLHLGAGISGRCIPLSLKYLKEGLTDNSYSRFFQTVMDEDSYYRHDIITELYIRYEDIVSTRIKDENVDVIEVGILGLGYRKDFRDIGGSPGMFFYKEFKEMYRINGSYDEKEYQRLILGVYDPLFSSEELAKYKLNSFDPFKRWDMLLIATPHTVFEIHAVELISKNKGKGSLVLDTYGIWEKHSALMAEKGITYVRVGNPNWISNQ